MDSYNEFIKCGEILMAPSSDFKDLYLLKCYVCDKYLSRFETFLSHHFTHYNCDEIEEPHSPSGALYELFGDMEEMDTNNTIQCNEQAVVNVGDEDLSNTFKIDVIKTTFPDVLQNHTNGFENITKINELPKQDDNLTLDRAETVPSEDKEDINKVVKIDSIQTTLQYDVYNETDTLETKFNDDSDKAEEDDYEMSDFDCSDDKSSSVEDTETGGILRGFMQSHESVLKVIELYRKQPLLWNLSTSKTSKRRSERIKCLQQITDELKGVINIKMSIKQLNTIINYLRRNYRTCLLKDEETTLELKEQKKRQEPPWFCQHLYFLKPFLIKNSLAVLDNEDEELKPHQIKKILKIYKECQFLWNSNLIENYCKNKRAEGIQQMTDLILTELNLDEKRRFMGINLSEEGQSEYFEHMMFLYDHIGPFQCRECRRVFKSLLQLKVHTFEHDGDIHLKCPQCSKGFKAVDTFVYHCRRHMQDLNTKCSECNKSFIKKCELIKHMEIHTNVKRYCCDICGSTFRHMQVLKCHKMRHEKKFSLFCPTCDKGFYKKSELDLHCTTHNDQRSFACNTCGKGFKAKKHLQQHELTHEIGRNHLCTFCHKSFKNKLNLSQHLKLHIRRNQL